MPQKNDNQSFTTDGIRVVEITGDDHDCRDAENSIIDLIREQQGKTGAKDPDLYSYRTENRNQAKSTQRGGLTTADRA